MKDIRTEPRVNEAKLSLVKFLYCYNHVDESIKQDAVVYLDNAIDNLMLIKKGLRNGQHN